MKRKWKNVQFQCFSQQNVAKRRAELPKAWRRRGSISTPMDSPAGHGYLHFGGRDASADGVEVADRCRGLHFVHNVSLHACGRPGPAPLAAWAPLNLESRGWRAGARRTGERAGANTVHTNLQSAVRRTGNSMESLIGGCSGEAINLAEGGGSHARDASAPNSAVFQAKTELFCQRSFEK